MRAKRLATISGLLFLVAEILFLVNIQFPRGLDFDEFHYVQSRIGMLDTFMFAFLCWGLAAFTAFWRIGLPPRQARRYLYFAGAMFGFSTCCKWFGLVPWVSCLLMIATVRLLQGWATL